MPINPSSNLVIKNAGAARNQALRSALALGAACGLRLNLRDIAGDDPRGGPGLGPGHLTAAAAAAKVCGGAFKGGIGVAEMEFLPGEPQTGEYAFDVALHQRSAAPLAWVLETVLPALARAGGQSQLMLQGGTHVLGGASSQYISRVLAPAWGLMGVRSSYTEIVPGFHPEGGGEAEVTVAGQGHLDSLQAEKGFDALMVGVDVVICGLPVHLAEQALEGAVGRLELHGFKPQDSLRRPKSAGRGLALTVWAHDARGLGVGFSQVGRRGGQPRALGLETAESLVSFLHTGAGLPGDLAAILAAPLACARGTSRLSLDRITPALRAALRVVESALPGSARLVERPGGGLAELTLNGADWDLSAR